MGDNCRDQEDDDRHRDTERAALADIDHHGRQAVDDTAVGNDERETAGQAQHAKGHDESWHECAGDELAVDIAGSPAGNDAGSKAKHGRRAEIDRDIGASHAGKPHHRTEREIEAAGSDNESGGDRQHADGRRGEQDIKEVA